MCQFCEITYRCSRCNKTMSVKKIHIIYCNRAEGYGSCSTKNVSYRQELQVSQADGKD